MARKRAQAWRQPHIAILDIGMPLLTASGPSQMVAAAGFGPI